MLREFVHGVRQLRARPGFAAAAILSLALGIGVITAIFTLLNAVVLRPLPYTDAGRLVWLTQVLKASSTDELTITPDFLDWRRLNRSFTGLEGYNPTTRNLTGAGEAVEVRTARASAGLLPLLGVRPMLGRNFTRDEDFPGRNQVAVLTHAFWQQRFGGDPRILGRPIALDGLNYTVTGVLGPDFVFPGPEPIQLITPLAKNEAGELQRGQSVSVIQNVIGRLGPGVTIPRAQQELMAIQAGLPPLGPNFHPKITIRMLPLRDHLFGNARTAGTVLIAAAAFLLLIACANVSNLLLGRLAQRDREMAVRIVLGGSRRRLIGQLLAESWALGLAACGLGVLLAWWLRAPLVALSPDRLAGFDRLPFDWRVLSFALFAGLSSTVLFAVLPAFRATEVRLADAIKSGSTSIAGGRGRLRLLSGIAAAEIATVLILSSGAGLMLESFWKLRYTNLGFQPERLIAATLSRPARGPRSFAFLDRLLARAQALPGIEAVALSDSGNLPPGVFHATNIFVIEGRPPMPTGQRPIARYQTVTPAYFKLLHIPLLRGRLLDDQDREGTPLSIVINQALADRYFRGEDPIGHRLRNGPPSVPYYEIVGVAGNVKTSGLGTAPEPAVYYALPQTAGLTEIGVVMRTPLSAGAIAAEFRRAVAEIDPSQPVAAIESLDTRLTRSVARPRFTAALLAAFAALALLLGLVGVYGVVGCRVRWQMRELAVRQALGAQPGDMVRHVLRQGFAIVGAGTLAGLAGALALGRALRSLLYEVPYNDPRTLAAAAALLAAVALTACWIPARRAARIDAAVALREE
jgi:predicted permease